MKFILGEYPWLWPATIIMATATALYARHKGHNAAMWFVFGLFGPFLSLAILALAMPNREDVSESMLNADAREALRSPVTRALVIHRTASVEELAEFLRMSQELVENDLTLLRSFGMAYPDDADDWTLSDLGRSVTKHVSLA